MLWKFPLSAPSRPQRKTFRRRAPDKTLLLQPRKAETAVPVRGAGNDPLEHASNISMKAGQFVFVKDLIHFRHSAASTCGTGPYSTLWEQSHLTLVVFFMGIKHGGIELHEFAGLQGDEFLMAEIMQHTLARMIVIQVQETDLSSIRKIRKNNPFAVFIRLFKIIAGDPEMAPPLDCHIFIQKVDHAAVIIHGAGPVIVVQRSRITPCVDEKDFAFSAFAAYDHGQHVFIIHSDHFVLVRRIGEFRFAQGSRHDPEAACQIEACLIRLAVRSGGPVEAASFPFDPDAAEFAEIAVVDQIRESESIMLALRVFGKMRDGQTQFAAGFHIFGQDFILLVGTGVPAGENQNFVVVDEEIGGDGIIDETDDIRLSVGRRSEMQIFMRQEHFRTREEDVFKDLETVLRGAGNPVQIFNRSGSAGLLGIFNCCKDPGKVLECSISPKDIYSLEGETFAVYSKQNGTVFTVKNNEKNQISLPYAHYDILTFSPIKEGLAPLGVEGKYIPPAVFQNIKYRRNSLEAELRCGGTILFYAEERPLCVKKDSAEIPFTFSNNLVKVKIHDKKPFTLTLKKETAS